MELFGPLPASLWDLFTTAPADMAETERAFGRLDDLVNGMAVVTKCKERRPRQDWAEFLAERGLYGFHWRSSRLTFDRHYYGNYYKESSPVDPLHIDSLSPAVAEIARCVRFPWIRFRESWMVDVGRRAECIWAAIYDREGDHP